MTSDEFGRELRRKFAEMQNELPRELGEEARKFFADSFDNQGWNGRAWTARKDDNPWPILIKSGELQSAVRGADIQASWEETTVSVSSDYGAYHNDGTDRLPQRQFMGDNPDLEKRLTEIIEERLKQVFEQ